MLRNPSDKKSRRPQKSPGVVGASGVTLHDRNAPRRGRRTLAAACGLAWAPTMILLWPQRPYVADLVSHFALHAAALLGLATLALVVFCRWGSAGHVGAATLVLLAVLRTHSAPPSGAEAPAHGAQRVKIISYNAYANHSRRDEVFVEWLRAQDADIIVIVDSPWRYLDAHPWLRESYLHRVEPSRTFEFPITLLSRFPLTPAHDVHPFEGSEVALRRSFTANHGQIVQLPNGSQFLLTALHPPSPRTRLTWKRSLHVVAREAAILSAWRRATAMPVVVTGDFNAAPYGRSNQRFGADSGLVCWGPMFRAGTWPANLSPWLSVPIDRVWTSAELVAATFRVGPRFRSDHRPVVAEIDVAAQPSSKENPGHE